MSNDFLTSLEMKPISSSSVVDQILAQIQQAIATGRFKMGDKLPSEYELMAELNVGRNSIREAIRVLTTMGVTEVRRGDGTYFCTSMKPSSMDFIIYSMLLDSSSANEIIELRYTLDKDVLNLAIEHATPEDIEILEDYIQKMRNYFKEGELTLAAKYDYDFHLHLAKSTKNRLLERIIIGIYRIFESSIERNIRTEEDFATADTHHQEMIECLKTKNYDKVNEVVKKSLETWSINVSKSSNGK